ncbi:MAG: VTT domain-containing protein [Promethearchaeota archaeon]
MKLKKVDVVFVILLIILTLFTFDLLFFEDHRAIITNIWDIESFEQIGFEFITLKLLIVFLVCLVGNVSPIPSPYTWSVCLGFAYFVINPLIPLLFGIVAALGSLLGELVGYYIGRGTAEIISDERKENLKGLQVFLLNHPKIAPFLIFLFGATPLTDDLLTIPLGILKYDVKKTIIFCWLGKFCLMLLFAYNVFWICDIFGGENWILSIISLYLIIILIYLMLRVNIVELIKKIVDK